VTKQFFAWGQTISGTNYFYTRDHLGSVRDVTDSTGTVQAHYEYGMFGEVTQTVGTLASDFQYAGYYYHAPSGLNLTTYRAYSPSLGRWINRDPVDFMDGGNVYAYANGNPISLNDPSGLRPLFPWEKDWIQHWFPNCFDLNRITINPLPLGGDRAFSPGNGDIYLPASDFVGNDPANGVNISDPDAAGTLGHELAHIEQAQQIGDIVGQGPGAGLTFLVGAGALQIGNSTHIFNPYNSPGNFEGDAAGIGNAIRNGDHSSDVIRDIANRCRCRKKSNKMQIR
jgi:RHS repeat-associated protein